MKIKWTKHKFQALSLLGIVGIGLLGLTGINIIDMNVAIGATVIIAGVNAVIEWKG